MTRSICTWINAVVDDQPRSGSNAMHIISSQSEGLMDGQHQTVDELGNGGQVNKLPGIDGILCGRDIILGPNSGVGDADKGSSEGGRCQRRIADCSCCCRRQEASRGNAHTTAGGFCRLLMGHGFAKKRCHHIHHQPEKSSSS